MRADNGERIRNMTESIDIGGPRLSSDQVADMIARELPGVEYDLVQHDRIDMMELRLQRRIEALRYALPTMAAYQPGVLNAATQHVVDTIRRKATDDYGLTPYIERLKREAADQARDEFAKALAKYVERFREKIPTIVEVEEDDGSGDTYPVESFVWGNLPSEVAEIVGWAAMLAATAPHRHAEEQRSPNRMTTV